jgi:hypothetical protein
MGGGNFSDAGYQQAAATRAATGQSNFGYSDQMRYVARDKRKAADSLDPFGATVREARDSAEHPESTPIVAFVDVTGSMGRVPQIIQRQLPNLMGYLTRGGYATDPQIMVIAVGDEEYDTVPLQAGQFESDNRIDEQIRDLYLEAGGGGDKKESYALGAYFLATRAQLDSLERRGKKGYCFIFGDEANKPRLSRAAVAKFIGDDLAEDMDIAEIYRQLEEKFHVWFVVPNMTSYYNEAWLENHWRPILGERFIRLEDPEEVCELIALTVGVMEDSITLDEGLADLDGTGRGAAAGKALAVAGLGTTTGTAVAAAGLLPADL